MANGLSISEFKEPGKYDRAELFIAKINGTTKDENGKPNKLFKRKDKEQFFEIKIDSETGKEAWNKKPIAFKDIPSGRIYKRLDTGEFLLLSEIEKTEEFGSSSGSGGGADKTAAVESMCCYFASYLFNPASGMDSFKQIEEKKDLLKYTGALTKFFKNKSNSKFVQAFDKDTALSFDDCLTHWSTKNKSDADWMYTFISTANIIKKRGRKFQHPVYFHRGSPFMDKIYAKKKKCETHNKDLVKSGAAPNELKEGLQKIGDDKWNPGDIWMSTVNPEKDPFSWTPQFMKKNMQTHVCDWPSLQQAVYESAIVGETLGISLKKSGKSANIKFFNDINPSSVKPSIRYSGFTFGNGDFFNSADVYIEFNSGKIQFRPYATTKSWQGEIKGTKASGGKAGGAPTNYYAELFFGRSIDKTEKIASGTWQEFKGTIGGKGKNISEKKKIYELYKKHNQNQKTKKNSTVKIKIDASPNPLEKLSKKDFTRTEDKKFHYYTYQGVRGYVSFEDFQILGDNYTNQRTKKLAPESFYFGKYMALALVDVIESGQPVSQNAFASELIRFAMSNIDNVSSFYWKIY